MQPTTRMVDVGDVSFQVTDAGDGLPVLMCHGFPGLGYSWRHQLAPIAGAGWRAVAPDMLGYGGSSAPADPLRYTNARACADLLAVLDALGADEVVVVGHDFGAPVAWNLALRAPDRVRGLALLGVPYDPRRTPVAPSVLYAEAAQRHFLHTHYFQRPGVADAELAADPRGFLSRLFFALSAGYHYLDIWQHPSPDHGYLDVLPEAPPLPWPWLSVAEFEHYVQVYDATGFTGGLNWYRALDANWADDSVEGKPIEVPTLFVAGSNEPIISIVGPSVLDTMRESVTDLRGVHLVDGAGHWLQQEQADAVNELLLDFLAGL